MKLIAIPNYNGDVVSHGRFKRKPRGSGKENGVYHANYITMLERMRPTCFV